jgi:hypothetical protein
MDAKAPLRLPHIAYLPKNLFTKVRPKYHVFGIINYGLGIFNYTNYYDWWAGDANLVISLLWLHLCSVICAGKSLHTLYLHADNCARDNKNRWMFAFLTFLVYLDLPSY